MPRFTSQGKTDIATYHVQGKRTGSVCAPTTEAAAEEIRAWYCKANGFGTFRLVYSDKETSGYPYIVLSDRDAILFCHYGNGRIIR